MQNDESPTLLRQWLTAWFKKTSGVWSPLNPWYNELYHGATHSESRFANKGGTLDPLKSACPFGKKKNDRPLSKVVCCAWYERKNRYAENSNANSDG